MTRRALLFAPIAALIFSGCSASKGDCSPTNCSGCCDEQAFCQVNFTASACGSAGAACVVCPTGNTCALGVCRFYGTGGGSGGADGGGGGIGGAGGGAADGGPGGGTGGGPGGGTGGGSGGSAGGGAAGGSGGGGGGTGGGMGGGSADAGPQDAGATHFAPGAVNWRVQASGTPEGFTFPRITLSVRVWDTFDLDGDGRPDLVQTANPADGQVWTNLFNQPVWKFFRNTGTAFAASVDWLVPASGTIDGFNISRSATKFAQWETFDIDGDRKPDLVQTANPLTDQVWAGPVWKVFKNTGAAFSTVPSNWPVPPTSILAPEGYFAKESTSNPKQWSTFDLDGDALPDLVVTSSSGVVFSNLGKPEWHFHKNLGTGFAIQLSSWSVPLTGSPDGFTMPESTIAPKYWATIDVDGDDRPDLVHTADPNTNRVFILNGLTFWRVYKNLGTGFAATFTTWPVPPNTLIEGFFATETQTSSRRWTTRDMNGDGLPDLVHTTNPATPGQVWISATTAFWNVYRNNRSGFVTTPVTWTVPASGLPEGFFTHVSNAPLNKWMSFDLDGDGQVDLVHTSNTAIDNVWLNLNNLPIWKLYRGER